MAPIRNRTLSRRSAGLVRTGWALLAVLVWAGSAGAAEFVLRSGETLDGEILQASRNSVVIRPLVGGPRQLARAEIETVRLAAGRGSVEGELLGWDDGVYEIAAGERALQIRDGRVLAEVARADPDEPAAPSRVAATDPVAPLAPAPAAGPVEPAPEPAPAATPTVATAEPSVEPTAAPAAIDRPMLRAEPIEIAETADAARFDLELSAPATEVVVVIYATLDGTAKAGIDFEKQQGVLTLLPGETRKQVEIPLLDGATGGDFTLYLVVDRDVAELAEPRVTGTILPAR